MTDHRPEVRELLSKLFSFKVGVDLNWPKTAFYGKDGYEKGDEDAPFWTEAFLYNLLGKDDARTLLGYKASIEAALREAEGE